MIHNRSKVDSHLQICLIALMSLINLGALEIQPSDEGYYALRAKAIVWFECWLDQTDYAIGGFHSSSHPPLLIWLMALSTKMFGMNAFALRLWSWISFVLTAWLMGRSATILNASHPNSSRIGMLLVGFSPLFVWYGRLAQFDMIVTFFSVLQGYFYFLFIDTKNLKYMFWCGIALGLALLSKTLVGIFVCAAILMHIALIFFQQKLPFKTLVKTLMIYLITGLGIGLSWFIVLCLTREHFFEQYIDWFIVDRLLRNQTHSEHISGVFYYVNVILTRFPLAAICFVWVLQLIKERNFRTEKRIFLLFWFLIPFVVLSLSSTKLLWYALLFMPPLALITTEAIILALSNEVSSVSKRLALVLMGIFSVWSLTQVWHRSIVLSLRCLLQESNVVTPEVWMQCIALLFLMILCFAYWWWSRREEEKRLVQTQSFLLKTIPLIAVGATIYTVLFGLPASVPRYTGAETMKEFVDREAPPALVHVLYDEHPNEPGTNPQFSYYFNGIDVNPVLWKSNVQFYRVELSEAATTLDTLFDQVPEALIIYEKTSVINEKYAAVLENRFEAIATLLQLRPLLESGRYVAYRREPYNEKDLH